VLLGSLWPALMQRFVVQPNELARERPYIAHQIAFTRQAFGLDGIVEREFPARSELSPAMLQRNAGTLENVRLWDYRPLLATYRKLQNLRQYYDFHDVDVDRYVIGGRLRQVMVAARELRHELLSPDAQTWVNLHLKFTHGYGAVVSLAAEVGGEGRPAMLVRDIPPVAEVPELRITRPEVYYGEAIRLYSIVRAREPEFDYPQGETNAVTTYQGRGGIPVGSWLNRLALALYTGDFNLLLSPQLTAESRALLHRQVRERAARIAPFLRYDRDPYLVIGEDGRLYWLLEAYTVARGYPYAQP
jgi:uncharacterized membrane protein (UPF0182 family)